MNDPTRQLDAYWQALGAMRAVERMRLREECAGDEDLLELFKLLDRLDAVRALIVEEGSKTLRDPSNRQS